MRQPHEERNEHEADPDYRFTLANERTFLAWMRRWWQVQSHMRQGTDLPANRDPIYLSLAVAGIAATIAVLLIWFRDQI